MFKTVFLSLFTILAIAVSTHAQSLNDDLSKKPSPPKAKPSKPVSTKKSPVNTPVKRLRGTSGGTKKLPPKRSVPQKPVVVENPETASEIISRFLNFQQTSSVTSKDWESVLNQTTQTLQANPNDGSAKAQMLVAQGELAFIRNDYSNALVHFNAASQVLPSSALPLYGIGRVYLATRQPSEAENQFERAIKLNNTFALAYKGIGDALAAQGKAKKANDYYSKAAKIGLAAQNTARPNTARPASQPNFQSNLVQSGSGNNSSVMMPVSQTSVQNPPQSPYEMELRNARALTGAKKWQESLSKLLTLAQSNPTADVYIAIGENYLGLEQMLSAQGAFKKATELNPNSAMAFYKSGMVLFEMNEYNAASDSFEKALILDQQGTTINRREARRMADKANEKAKNPNSRKKFLNIL